MRNSVYPSRWFWAIVVIAVTAGYLLADWWQGISPELAPKFVGRAVCAECHQAEAAKFTGSHHDRAMDYATAETVKGDFNDAELQFGGRTSRMFRKGEEFWIATTGPQGEEREYQVRYVFGVEPLQQYMVEVEAPPAVSNTATSNAVTPQIGRVQVLRESWDTIHNRWYYLSPPDVTGVLDPDDPLNWLGSTQCWNTNCAECHSTFLQKNFDPLSNRFATTFSEVDVSCEACHGPGSHHVSLARAPSPFWDRHWGYGLNRLKNSSAAKQVETCAPCHSRRQNVAETWTPGESYAHQFQCQLIEHPIYHRDGQIWDEDYVYGSFIQSKMYANNIRCTDCHDPHSLQVKFPDNRLCTSCHQHPASKYDSPAHHFHQAGSPGAQCVECHMPANVYMQVDARRDHSLRAPRPDVSVKLGTPNACTGCHLDIQKLPAEERQTIVHYQDWLAAAEKGNAVVKSELERVNGEMAAAFERWYGTEQHPLRTTYYAETAALLLGLESSPPLPAPELVAAVREFVSSSAPAQLRASVLHHTAHLRDRESEKFAKVQLRTGDVSLLLAAIPRVEVALNAAADGAWSQEQQELLESLDRLLEHPAQTVRFRVAQALVFLPADVRNRSRTPRTKDNFSAAIREWRDALQLHADRGSTHSLLGNIALALGDRPRAEDHFRTAIRVAPHESGPRGQLATLLEETAAELRGQGSATSANDPLAQKLAEDIRRLRLEEHELLKADLRRAAGFPQVHAVHYRVALSSYLIGDLSGLLENLLEAHRLAPQEPTYLIALVQALRETGRWDEAVQYAERLKNLAPDNPEFQQLWEAVRTRQ